VSLTIAQARDEILTMLKTAIDASSYDDIEIRYQDIPVERVNSVAGADENPPPFLQVEIMHLGGGQTSLGPVARWTRRGLLRVQVFAPTGLGMSTLDEIAQIVLDAYEGHSSPGGVWFRNGHIREMGPDGIWTRMDVLVDFTYNERK
jgi:hypothetical protein